MIPIHRQLQRLVNWRGIHQRHNCKSKYRKGVTLVELVVGDEMAVPPRYDPPFFLPCPVQPVKNL